MSGDPPVSAAEWALLEGLVVPADLSTPQAVARWFWTLWLRRPVFARQDGAQVMDSLVDRGMITGGQVDVFGDALEAATARELSDKGYATLSTGPLPLQRIIPVLGLSHEQSRMVLGGVVMWVWASGRVVYRAGGWREQSTTLWPQRLAALDRRWAAAVALAARWTDASLGAVAGQEWEWRGTQYLLALALYVLSHVEDLPPAQLAAAQVADLLADGGLERIGRPLLTGLGHSLSRSLDDPTSIAWSWVTRTWPEVTDPHPVYRYKLLSRRPETPEVDTPAWIICADWAVAAARNAT